MGILADLRARYGDDDEYYEGGITSSEIWRKVITVLAETYAKFQSVLFIDVDTLDEDYE